MRLLRKFKYIYRRALSGVRDFSVVHNFVKASGKRLWKDDSKEFLSLEEDFHYKDETWEPVKNLNELLLSASMHKHIHTADNECILSPKGRIKNGSLIVDTRKFRNNWLCFFYNKPLPQEYVFGFDIAIHTEFKEIQFAFRYKDLANRLRFLIRDNREAAFEIIRNGIFYRHVFSKAFSLQMNTTYHVAVEVQKNRYRFIVNGEPILSVYQLVKVKFPGNRLGLILYNETADSAVNCTISNVFFSNICTGRKI